MTVFFVQNAYAFSRLFIFSACKPFFIGYRRRETVTNGDTGTAFSPPIDTAGRVWYTISKFRKQRSAV